MLAPQGAPGTASDHPLSRLRGRGPRRLYGGAGGQRDEGRVRLFRSERGRYSERFREGSNVVVLDPDVAAALPDSKALNDALRRVAGLD